MTYENIISPENLLCAWAEFRRGKRGRPDVQRFERYLIDNILSLNEDLKRKTYVHGGYKHFKVNDPKPRDIHKASVRDRLVHHAVYRILYPFFDTTFIHDSYSCRKGKGSHAALHRFRQFAFTVSKNHTHTCWVLKCDIKKFFANIDQVVLLEILKRRIPNQNIMRLLQNIIERFSVQSGIGLPLGNLTSQLLVNIYMNEFDQFVKHILKARHYIRYGDDFVFFSQDRAWLEDLIPHVRDFLRRRLRLELHPQKVSITTVASGVDFLGWVHFPDHRVLRTATKRRMMRRMQEHPLPATRESHLGLLSYGNTTRLQKELLNLYWLASRVS